MALQPYRKKQTDVVNIGLEQVTLEMSKLLRDFHKNLRNLSLINVEKPIFYKTDNNHKVNPKKRLGNTGNVKKNENNRSATPKKGNNRNGGNNNNKMVANGSRISNGSKISNNSSRLSSNNSSRISNNSAISNNSRVQNNNKPQQHQQNKQILSLKVQPLQLVPFRQPKANSDDSFRAIKQTVDDAIRNRKTFTVCGNYTSIKRALRERGWIEKIRLSYNTRDRENLRHLQSMSINELITRIKDKEIGNACKRMIMSKLLYNHQVDFYWDDFNDAFKVNNDKIKYTLINKFKRTIFSYTSKQGLCEAVKRAHWYQKPGTSIIRHPRSYSLTNQGDPKDFIDDYKTTAAISLLKWIVATNHQHKHKLVSESGKIPISSFLFAVEECIKVIKKAKHEDIDCDIEEALDYQWNQFLDHYYKLVHIGNHFKADHNKVENEASIVQKAQYVLRTLEMYFPNLDMDGMMNIWILKPVAGCRGQGIHICRTLQYILEVIKSNTNMRYIIQKYIEKPLLIYNTKFDIRQWFLISSSCPLTIWIYKECYLRFSSQTYNLRKLHESIHLTNNSVQCKYKNTGRDIALPNYNMWDTAQFKSYLKNIGFPNVYEKVIYPGMKQCITGAILLNQDNIDQRKNSFELYGADFMLTEDFQPWLIEINAKPAMYGSTPVTAKMCPQVLDDLIKVIIDIPQNAKAKTGNFELLYKQNIPRLPKVVDVEQLKLQGRPLSKDYFYEPKTRNDTDLATISTEKIKINEIEDYIAKVNEEMHNALRNLMEIIETERKRRGGNYNLQMKNAICDEVVGTLEEVYDSAEKEQTNPLTCPKFSTLERSGVFHNIMNFLKNVTNHSTKYP